jgi:hypothetical protein
MVVGLYVTTLFLSDSSGIIMSNIIRPLTFPIIFPPAFLAISVYVK